MILTNFIKLGERAYETPNDFQQKLTEEITPGNKTTGETSKRKLVYKRPM